MSEKIGRHKGALETLMQEKKELSRILKIVNSQIERHLGALEEEGLDRENVMNQLAGEDRNDSGAQEREEPGGSADREQEDAGDMLEDDSGDFSERDFSPR